MRPLRARMLDREIGFRPRHLARHAHLFEPRLACLPAMMFEEVRRGGEHVGHAFDEVPLAVAVIVDGEIDVVARHELHLADFARPCPVHLRRGQVAAVEDRQRRHQLGAELVRPPAIVGERRQRLQRGEVAEIGAEIRLKSPKGDEDRPRHAELMLDAREDAGVPLEQAFPFAQPIVRRPCVRRIR